MARPLIRLAAFAALALAGLAAGGALAGEGAEANRYALRIDSLVDSDTYRAVVTIWPGLEQRVDVRLAGVDTPEHFRPSRACKAHERALAARAKALAGTAIDNAQALFLTGVANGKYAGRVVGDVILIDTRGRETRLAALLIESGLAVPYDGGTKVTDWCGVPAPPG